MRIQFVRLAMRFVGWISRYGMAVSVLAFLLRAARRVKELARHRPFTASVVAVLVCASVLLAQLPFVQVVQPPPPSVTGAGAAYVGPSGGVPIYYWVIARYPVGSSAYPTGPIPAINTQGVQSLGGGSTVTVTWQTAVGATGYDVLRSTTTQVPIPCSFCAIALNTASLTVTDSGGDGSAYPPGGLTVAQTATATLAVNNRDQSTPFAYIQIGSTIVPLQPGLAPVSSVFGRTGVVVAALNDYAFNQISGFLGLSQIATGDKHGDGSKIQMFGAGTPATDDCAKFDANGNVVSAGAACGSGAGTVSSVFGRTGAVVAALNDYAFNLISGTLALTQIAAGDKQGNGAKIQMFGGGSPATDDCAKFDANGNVISSGAACGTGGTVASVFGRTGVVVAALNDYAFSLISGTLALSQIASGDKHGDGSKIQMFGSGTPATNDCAKFDANGNVVSAGAACGSSGGALSAGTGIDASELASNIVAVDEATVAPMPLSFTTSQDFGSISNGTCAVAVTVSSLSGVMAGDALVVGSNPPLNAGLFAVVKASTTSGEATLTVCNLSGSAVDPANSTYRIVKPVLAW